MSHRSKTGSKTRSGTGSDTGPETGASPDATAASGSAFVPFADDAAVQTLGTLSIENGTARIGLHGSLDLTRDRAGLARARALKATVDAIVAALQAAELPEAVADDTRGAETVKNPFA